MRISKWSYTVMFDLQIKIFNTKGINIFRTHLYPEFIGPPSIVGLYFRQFEFIQQQLTIYLEPLCKIGFQIKTYHCIIIATVLLFDRAVKYNRSSGKKNQTYSGGQKPLLQTNQHSTI